MNALLPNKGDLVLHIIVLLKKAVRLKNSQGPPHALEVASHHADAVLRAELFELIAWSSSIAGQVMDYADGLILRIDHVRAAAACGLGDHRIGIIRIDGSVWPEGFRIDDGNIQLDAAASAPKAYHCSFDIRAFRVSNFLSEYTICF